MTDYREHVDDLIENKDEEGLPNVVRAYIADPTDPTGTPIPTGTDSPEDVNTEKYTILSTDTEESIGTGTYPKGFSVLADEGNAESIFIGPTGATTFPLSPGNSIGIDCKDLSKLKIFGESGDIVHIIGGV